MFIYLNKKIKIAIPDPVDVNSISWNKEKGWIVVGGEKGLLKVLRMDALSTRGKDTTGGSLTMNQTLDGHEGDVQVVTWNEHYQKLTSSDENGLITVWLFYKGHWYEEMINNRNKSVVKGMRWNPDGQKICIVYEDGYVIVGGVDGDRQWGREIGTELLKVEWSPDSKKILFGTKQGEVHVYDAAGTFIEKMDLQCLQGSPGTPKIIGMSWYGGEFGFVEAECPVLAVCFQNGRLQIMRSESDEEPQLVDAEMTVVQCEWNQQGTVLALAGMQEVDDRNVNVVQFYTPFGDHLRTLKVPGNSMSSLSWEGGGLRLALAVEHFIFFASVRPDYKWGYFGDTIVYAFTKPDRTEHCCVFWDTQLHGHQIKYVKNLLGIAAAGDHCVLSTKTEDDSNQHVLILCNAMGTPVDSKYIDIEPKMVAMSKTHIVAASENCVYTWAYSNTLKESTAGASTTTSSKHEKMFHVEDSPSGAKEDISKFKKHDLQTDDCICCLALGGKKLMIGRESGTMQQYDLPRVAIEGKFLLKCRPDRIAINCDATRVSIIDINGVLTLFDTAAETKNPETGEVSVGAHLPGFERKDVWDMRWAEDNNELLATMERTYMYIFKGTDPEEPHRSNGWLCEFNNLQVRSVLLDDVLQDPEHPTKECLMDVEVKSLRDTRALLDKVGIDDAAIFIEDNPHPRLWRLLAESALQNLNFEIAEKAFVRCEDYQGIEFIKRLKRLDDPVKQTAEVAVYFERFEEAERMYLEIDRADLAQQLRIKLGDWFRVVQLIKSWSSGGGDDKLMEKAWDRIGDYYADRLKWESAAQFYVLGRDKSRLAECYYHMEDYTKLQAMVYSLAEDDSLLGKIADMFAAVGLCDPAVEAFTRCKKIKEAIDVCISLNQWDVAIELANRHNVKDIDTLLAKYASHLLSKDKVTDAIELYIKAKHYLEAAKLLYGLAKKAAKSTKTPLRAKQLYVLAALQVDAYRELKKARNADPTLSAIDGMVAEDSTTPEQTRMIDTAWRGAEAFHYFLLAQRQLYSGRHADSLRTAMVLIEYDDIIDPVQAYSVLALAAVVNKSYSACSKAFVKLESIRGLKAHFRKGYEDLALKIFSKHRPNPEKEPQLEWDNSFSKCSVVSGRPVTELEFWICGRCARRAGVSEITNLQFCPLCHAPIYGDESET
eukprot:m.115408 g.115408  ORF g.115408 m.115408 type:complete len:1163 (+) comp14202_c1_seq1:133-3621(+)